MMVLVGAPGLRVGVAATGADGGVVGVSGAVTGGVSAVAGVNVKSSLVMVPHLF